MVCKQCGCTIPKGTKFQQTKYKSSAFCSEECFNTYDKNTNTNIDVFSP